jgi:hypothetical protein
VTVDRSGEPDLANSLAHAIEDYRATWHPVDCELYDICRRRPSQRTFADVYTKVAIIGRVYAAGISRTVQVDGDPEAAVARGLVEQAGLIDQMLQTLVDSQLDRTAASKIIELHARVARGLLPHTGGTWQQSFVSKYLHFHCNVVPVYDSRAEAAIGRFVNWSAVYSARHTIGHPADWLTRYYNFATAFVVLYERAAAATLIQPTVKEVDYLLWQPAQSERHPSA